MGSLPPASTKSVTIPVLFTKQPDPEERGRPGLGNTFSGVIYVSPLQLIENFGEYKIDAEKYSINLAGHDYVVDWLDWLEEAYDTCVAVEIKLKSKLRE